MSFGPIRTAVAACALLALPGFLVAETREEKMARCQKTLQTAKDPKDRVEAIQEMARIGQLSATLAEPVLPALKKALKDKEAKVRAAAAHALGQLAPDEKKEVVDELVNLLKEDKSEQVRQGAARGLAAIGDQAKEAVPALREAQKTAGKADARVYRDAIMTINGRKK